MHYVYIIYSSVLKRKYIGSTANLRERIKRHNSRRSVFTSKGEFWRLIYYEAFVSKKDAEAEGKFLKSGKGRERMKYLLKNSI